MSLHRTLSLLRDCDGIQVPAGAPVTLSAGTLVNLTQSLGGSFTVMTNHGLVVRIAGKDADALGLVGDSSNSSPTVSEGSLEEQVWQQLRTCFDPEIPIDIVELGLVYLCRILPVKKGHRIELQFTLTAPGCGMGPVLQSEIESKLSALPGVTEVNVQLVLDPPWDTSRMSEAARLDLGMI